jgi:16S rRNA (uracil1498-N3)-methyltransferase
LRADAAPSHLWVPDLAEGAEAIELSAAESHYALRVVRARPGDRLTATDGKGALATLVLERAGARAQARIERFERAMRSRTAWVCGGPPEGRRGDWLVEKLGELGIAVWQPIDCERGEWRATAASRERWGRLAVAALRQSRRRFLLDVRDPVRLADLATVLPIEASRWLADPDGRAGIQTPSDPGASVGVIGPASGFTAAEKGRLEDLHFERMSLSDGRLRSETAALAWASWWAAGDPARGPASH